MTGFANIGGGSRRMVGLAVADAATHTIFTARKERPTIDGIVIANPTGGAVNAVVKWNDGSNDYNIIPSKSLASHDYIFIPGSFLPLNEGQSIKVAGNGLEFTIIIVEGGSAFAG